MKDEVRICEVCGKEMTQGYTDCDSSMYVCDDCFESFMDESFGKHRWMMLGNDEEDEYGGYYIASAENVGGYVGTGIFWTMW